METRTAILNVEFNSAPSQLMVTNELLLVENDAEKQKVIRLIGFGVCEDAHTTQNQPENIDSKCIRMYFCLCVYAHSSYSTMDRSFFLCYSLFHFRCVVARRVNLFSLVHSVVISFLSISHSLRFQLRCSIYQDEKLR